MKNVPVVVLVALIETARHLNARFFRVTSVFAASNDQ